MLYTKREQLTILEVNDDKVSMQKLKMVMQEKPSNIIYCERKGILLGIISTGDIWRAYSRNQDKVVVNQDYSSIFSSEYLKAKELFQDNKNINAIPVITENHVLIGDYKRWNDLYELDYLIDTAQRRSAEQWKKDMDILLVHPGRIFVDRQRIFEKFKEHLTAQGRKIKCIEHSEVFRYLKENTDNRILFVDEDELRASRIYLRIAFGVNGDRCSKLMTYKRVFDYEIHFNEEECMLYLKQLQEKGIKVLGLVFRDSIYYDKLLKEIADRFAKVGETPGNKLPKAMYKDFFDNLYSDEYADGIMNMPIEYRNNESVFCLRDCTSQYYNVINGERNTVNQPKRYRKSIYFFGACYIYGHYAEDKYTIESFLQERICQDGKEARVVNCGGFGAVNIYSYLPRIASTQLKKGDIIVIDRPPENVPEIIYLDLNQVLEEKGASSEWLINMSCHCNHKVNKLYADAIYDMLKNELDEEDGQRGLIEKEENLIDILYLNRHFSNFDFTRHGKIGTIVMNCNPFTLGHRYLIEQALKVADFLILFVVEEDRSLFPFTERFAMVREGTKDLQHVMVVPSGPFILSQMTFPEYFIKEKRETIIDNTENDIKVFAEKIVPRLGIKCRVFGEEPFDEITQQYNNAMKKLLPQYGIEAIEIPRKTMGGDVISASRVRKYMEKGEIDKLSKLLPETTKKVLGLN